MWKVSLNRQKPQISYQWDRGINGKFLTAWLIASFQNKMLSSKETSDNLKPHGHLYSCCRLRSPTDGIVINSLGVEGVDPFINEYFNRIANETSQQQTNPADNDQIRIEVV